MRRFTVDTTDSRLALSAASCMQNLEALHISGDSGDLSGLPAFENLGRLQELRIAVRTDRGPHTDSGILSASVMSRMLNLKSLSVHFPWDLQIPNPFLLSDVGLAALPLLEKLTISSFSASKRYFFSGAGLAFLVHLTSLSLSGLTLAQDMLTHARSLNSLALCRNYSVEVDIEQFSIPTMPALDRLTLALQETPMSANKAIKAFHISAMPALRYLTLVDVDITSQNFSNFPFLESLSITEAEPKRTRTGDMFEEMVAQADYKANFSIRSARNAHNAYCVLALLKRLQYLHWSATNITAETFHSMIAALHSTGCPLAELSLHCCTGWQCIVSPEDLSLLPQTLIKLKLAVHRIRGEVPRGLSVDTLSPLASLVVRALYGWGADLELQ
jgi:hypothetical protein